MDNNNPDPQFAGTLDLEAGTAQRVADNPNLVDDPNAVINEPAPGGGDGSAAPAPVVPHGTPEPQKADYLKLWNERAGTQYQTDDEAIEDLKVSRTYKEKITDYEKKLGELSVLDDPFVRDIARAKKAGIGIELYLEAVKMDVDKLEAKQALKEDFLRSNAELVASDPEFAVMKFERDYISRFGKIGETLDVSGLDEFEAKEKTLEFNRDQEFLKRSLNAESMQSKNRLKEWKQKYVTIPDVQAQTGMTDAQIQQYTSQVEVFVNQNEKIEIPVGEQKFNFGLKDYKETLKKELLYPLDTLKKHGIDWETGNIDVEKLGKLLTAAYVGTNVAKPLSDWSLDARNIELLRQKQITPAPAQPIAAGVPPEEDDLYTRMGKGIKAQREAQSQS
jgi:hypothetical protein